MEELMGALLLDAEGATDLRERQSPSPHGEHVTEALLIVGVR